MRFFRWIFGFGIFETSEGETEEMLGACYWMIGDDLMCQFFVEFVGGAEFAGRNHRQEQN